MRRFMTTLLLGAALAAPGGAAALAQDGQPFRMCSDPDNLPFSSAASGAPGLYVELGQLLARALGRPFEPVWSVSYFGKRTVRTTLLAGACDAYVGLPDDPDFLRRKMLVSRPFLRIGYAIMAPPGMHVGGLDDLAGKRVAVQFSTPPQILLAQHEEVHATTYLNPDEAARAVVHGEADAAFIWGPVAGYVNATALHGTWQVIPVAGEGMQWQVVIGFARSATALRDQADAVLAQAGPAIGALAAKYGLPLAAPVELAGARPAVVLAAATTPAPDAPVQTAIAQPPAAPATAPDPKAVAAGHEVFNSICSHCHGPDAVQSVKRIDLRLLRHRYTDRMDDVFMYTVTHGRPAKGMPNWSGVFTEMDFHNILSYLHTVQTAD